MFDNVFNHQGVIFKMIAGMIFALIKRPFVRLECLISHCIRSLLFTTHCSSTAAFAFHFH